MNHKRTGHGKPLMLIHGLGSSLRTWDTILDPLAAQREVVAIDLPGFGATPPLSGKPTIAALTDAVVAFLGDHDLRGVDVVGSSMGGRIALELARRGEVGATVALDPGGFWTPGEVRFFELSVGASIRLVRALAPAMPFLTGNAAGRTMLFAQFSARPWALPADATLNEMRDFASSPTIMQTLHELVHGPTQEGAPRGSTPGPITIGWGRSDRVTLPSQAQRAQERFPGARLHWFHRCGHFPHWDAPEVTSRLILDATAQTAGHPVAA